MNRDLILIVHNIRSCYNVGSLLRSADGLGVKKVYLTGYTPYPLSPNENRLPHEAIKIDRQIHKTALGAERSVVWEQHKEISKVFAQLHKAGFRLCALEQTSRSIDLLEYKAPTKIALLVGREVEGIEQDILENVDDIVAIPMRGRKESFNVAIAAALALYHLRFLA